MAEFQCQKDYYLFAQSVRQRSRYVFEPHVEEFLNAVLGTVGSRIFGMESGSVLYRSQLGHAWRQQHVNPDDPEFTIDVECAYAIPRMKPLRESAREGRVNPKGIPSLYLCDDRDTAMAETRPWIGSFVSLGEFTVKQLRLVNCCDPKQGFVFSPSSRKPKLSPERLEKIAWGAISQASNRFRHFASQLLR